jgi:hypothetical protein
VRGAGRRAGPGGPWHGQGSTTPMVIPALELALGVGLLVFAEPQPSALLGEIADVLDAQGRVHRGAHHHPETGSSRGLGRLRPRADGRDLQRPPSRGSSAGERSWSRATSIFSASVTNCPSIRPPTSSAKSKASSPRTQPTRTSEQMSPLTTRSMDLTRGRRRGACGRTARPLPPHRRRLRIA